MTNIQTTTTELHRCFALLNTRYFGGSLPEPAITIQSQGKRSAYGWCSRIPFWHGTHGSAGSNAVDYGSVVTATEPETEPVEPIEPRELYEINLSAEHLNRDKYGIIRTLLHEMVHLHNGLLKVKDVSRGGTYHNLRFKAACERDGMFRYDIEKPDKKIGWSQAVLTDETRAFIDTMDIADTAFSIYREVPPNAKKPSNSYKLECPTCGMKLRASKPGLAVRCKECEEDLVEV